MADAEKNTDSSTQNTELIVRYMMEICPYLVNGDPELAHELLDFFSAFIQKYRTNSALEKKPETEFYVKSFLILCDTLGKSTLVFDSCEDPFKVIRDAALNEGLLAACMSHLADVFGNLLSLKQTEQTQLINDNAHGLPMILQILTGFVRGHNESQNLALELEIIPVLHAIEKVSTENRVGPMAETLLEALMYHNETIAKKVLSLRKETEEMKKKKALEKRNKMLKKISKPKKNISKKILGKSSDLITDEPSELKCMVCHEGYHFKPTELLGVYVLQRVQQSLPPSLLHANLTDNLEANPVMSCSLSTALKPPKKEWDGAQLRNGQMPCNNLLPIQSTHVDKTTPKISSSTDNHYSNEVSRYWNLSGVSGFEQYDRKLFDVVVEDVRTLLGKFAYEESFTSGGQLSNLKLLPVLVQIAVHEYNQKLTAKDRLSVQNTLNYRLTQIVPDLSELLVLHDNGMELEGENKNDWYNLDIIEVIWAESLLLLPLSQWHQCKGDLLIKFIKHTLMDAKDNMDQYKVDVEDTSISKDSLEMKTEDTIAEKKTIETELETKPSTENKRECICGAALKKVKDTELNDITQDITIICGRCKQLIQEERDKAMYWKCTDASSKNKIHAIPNTQFFCDACVQLNTPLSFPPNAYKWYDSRINRLVRPIFIFFKLIDALQEIFKKSRDVLLSESGAIDIFNTGSCADCVDLVGINCRCCLDDILKELEALLKTLNEEWLTCQTRAEFKKLIQIDSLFPEIKDKLNETKDNWIELLIGLR
ncbi:hypothetical protein RFI_02009 [Reticulomyxa filosa]|uniref:E3 ubiquitin ligase UBR4 C-terminal domain-containing protein n=1 Tax=Reticulomyxa filosa TaxID=46433 RepID=X6PAB2_RETFI|nr:hypothetical protein RFI_02009 [Reticulomyxa filosa]|eukprot:ETO35068.1 hypothetical protein RFI_02009 [Reticulomyxa filosa]